MKYEEISYDELEQLALVGGSDSNAITTADSAITTTTIQVSIAATALTVAWSILYSCTKNKAQCQRK